VPTDRIEREIIIDAPRDRVWAALTEPGHLCRWFGDSAEVDLTPGGKAAFGWSEYQATHHAVIELVEPPGFLSYRWARPAGAAVNPGNSTVVAFTLTEAESGGTRLTVAETGFTSLDGGQDERGTAVQENTEGWRKELSELKAYAEMLN